MFFAATVHQITMIFNTSFSVRVKDAQTNLYLDIVQTPKS